MAKSKYIIVVVLSLILVVFGCFSLGSCEKKEKKRIVLINSYGEDHIGYGHFESDFKRDLDALNISADVEVLYLDCDIYNREEEIDQMRLLLDSINPNNVDLILVVNDQAAYSCLKTDHPILKQLPIILVNINYPNEEALDFYKNDRIYVLRDTPAFKENIAFIKALYGEQFVKIIYNLDFTFLGNKSLMHLRESIENNKIRIAINRKELLDDYVYNTLSSSIIELDLDRYIINDTANMQTDFMIHMAPLRYMNGLSLINLLSITRTDQNNNVFLLDKIDVATRSLPQIFGIPAFSCVRESFDKKTKIIGGYIASDELSSKATSNLAYKIFQGISDNEPKIQDIEKEYLIDWSVFSLFDVYKTKKIHPNVRFVNYPFQEKYKHELYLAGTIFIIIFFVMFIVLIIVHRSSLREKENSILLKKMHRRLSSSLSGGSVITWRINETEIEFDNNFLKISGLDRHVFSFEELKAYHHPDDISICNYILEQVVETREMFIKRLRLCFSGNDEYEWYEVRCSSYVNQGGNVIAAGILFNVQDLVVREQELIRAKELAEKAELKQSFLTNMSHEIRTPLNAIIGFTNILMSDDADDFDASEKEEMLSLVNNNSELLLKLISDVLDLSRLDSNSLMFSMEESNLIPILKEIFRGHQVIIKPSLDFILDLDDSKPIFVNIDKMRFTQVLSNLLSNSNKFTESGYIKIGCEVDIQLKKVRIYVEDSGKGIAKEEQKTIFDRFFKSDEFAQGTGLGLSICKVIVDRLSGEIVIESEIEKGSRFIVTLPILY